MCVFILYRKGVLPKKISCRNSISLIWIGSKIQSPTKTEIQCIVLCLYLTPNACSTHKKTPSLLRPVQKPGKKEQSKLIHPKPIQKKGIKPPHQVALPNLITYPNTSASRPVADSQIHATPTATDSKAENTRRPKSRFWTLSPKRCVSPPYRAANALIVNAEMAQKGRR